MVFTDEDDSDPRRKKGKDLAQEHEDYLDRIQLAKEELRYRVIPEYELEEKKSNMGYDSVFIFYWHSGISEKSLQILNSTLAFSESYSDRIISKYTEEGWYIVRQKLYEEDSSNGYYTVIDFFEFRKLEDYKNHLETKFRFYEELLSTLQES